MGCEPAALALGASPSARAPVSALDVEIGRVRAAVERYRSEADARREAIEEDGGPQSAHEHDAVWNARADKIERASTWLAVLLRKRGTEDDLKLAHAIKIDAWP